jgi:organic radical activating enzyme
MKKHNVDFLDFVIIRSCQLACEGCCTFSDHREINGLVEPADAEEAVKFWSQYINPGRVHLFGGEPTMHPRLIEWIRLARKYFPESGANWINTNGYYLDKLFDHIDELFVDNSSFISVTHHSTIEPYNSLVINNYNQLQKLVLEAWKKRSPSGNWQWIPNDTWSEGEYKKFICLTDTNNNHVSVIFNMTFQAGPEGRFVSHYQGRGLELKPWQDYNDTSDAAIRNHSTCHIKNYVQLYKNRLWKCPPRAVLNQTLETYNLQNTPEWSDYYNKYESLGTDATETEINQWFNRQLSPENTCNMCGFIHNNHPLVAGQQHLPKKIFKLKQA